MAEAFDVSGAFRDRCADFIQTFMDAPTGTQCEIWPGRDLEGGRAVSAKLAGREFNFRAQEAYHVANAIEQTCDQFPEDEDLQTLRDVSITLRAVASATSIPPANNLPA